MNLITIDEGVNNILFKYCHIESNLLFVLFLFSFYYQNLNFTFSLL
jgi:hypothetical protein